MAQSYSEGISSASESPNARFYLTVTGAGIKVDGARQLDDVAAGIAIGAGWQINEQFGMEGFIQRDEYPSLRQVESRNSIMESAGIRAVLYPNIGNVFGYLGLGFGTFRPGGDAADGYESVLWSGGVGYASDTLSTGIFDLRLRAEIGFRADMHSGSRETINRNNSFNEVTAQIGVIFPLGTAHKNAQSHGEESITLVPVLANPDLDGDGVDNLMDACPDTSPGSAVDSIGCSVP